LIDSSGMSSFCLLTEISLMGPHGGLPTELR
jgi:hypothetical protein